MAIKDALRAVALVFAGRAVKKRVERDMASAVADEIARRDAAKERGGPLWLAALLCVAVLVVAGLFVWRARLLG